MKFVTSAVRSAVRPITVAIAMAIGLNMQAPFVLAVDVVVTTDADSGAGSLREAVGTAMSYRIGGLVEYQSENFYALVAGGAGSQDYEVRRWLDAFQGSSFAESSFDGTAQFGYLELGKLLQDECTVWGP